MAIGHAGERMIEGGIHEGGALAVVGLIVGAVLGWPRKTVTGQGVLSITTWHNAFTSSGDFGHVLEAGIFAAGVICVLAALLGMAIRSSRPSRRTPSGVPSAPLDK